MGQFTVKQYFISYADIILYDIYIDYIILLLIIMSLNYSKTQYHVNEALVYIQCKYKMVC